MNSESKEQQDSDNQVALSIPLRYDAEIHFTRYAYLCKQTREFCQATWSNSLERPLKYSEALLLFWKS